MNNRDHNKLMQAGFTIIRADSSSMTVKEKTAGHSWKKLRGPFETKAALKKEMEMLLKFNLIVED